MAATTGFELESSRSMSSRSVGCAVLAGVPNSRISAPPEKKPPAPVRTMALTVESPCARVSASAMPPRTACERPLTGGLAKEMTATERSTR
jgi:hypothetical protein